MRQGERGGGETCVDIDQEEGAILKSDDSPLIIVLRPLAHANPGGEGLAPAECLGIFRHQNLTRHLPSQAAMNGHTYILDI